MARLNQRRTNYRALARIEQKGRVRAERIARYIVDQIHTLAPYDTRANSDTKGPHLKDSYHVRQDPITGDMLIWCSRRYWVFVEFGTKNMKAQKHVRTALEMAKRRFG